jgi:hypothetical protein
LRRLFPTRTGSRPRTPCSSRLPWSGAGNAPALGRSWSWTLVLLRRRARPGLRWSALRERQTEGPSCSRAGSGSPPQPPQLLPCAVVSPSLRSLGPTPACFTHASRIPQAIPSSRGILGAGAALPMPGSPSCAGASLQPGAGPPPSGGRGLPPFPPGPRTPGSRPGRSAPSDPGQHRPGTPSGASPAIRRRYFRYRRCSGRSSFLLSAKTEMRRFTASSETASAVGSSAT